MRHSFCLFCALLAATVVGCGQSAAGTPEPGGGGSMAAHGGATGAPSGGNHDAGTLSFAGESSGGTSGMIGMSGSGGSGGSAAAAGTAGQVSPDGGRGGTSGGGGATAAAGHSGNVAIAGSGGATTGSGPCDVYAVGNTPCIAAHSTVRALSSAYDGKLYQVRRASDKTSKDIGVLTPGGFADAAAQDAFCANTTCTISILYDQSGKANHLTVGPAGGAGKADVESNASALKLKVGGHSVYAVFIAPGNGYRNNKTTSIATGNDAQGAYMVTSGKHVNDGCCFDYGNAETNNKDTGNGHMEAIYVGKLCWFPPCNGSGPWVMADLENGLFSGANGVNDKNTSVPYEYLTAMLKGHSAGYAIKAGNAQSGALTTMYDGALPTKSGYNPMHLEGAIILGVGGDNSNASAGTFFEGAMTAGFPSAASDDAVQANIVAAGYGH